MIIFYTSPVRASSHFQMQHTIAILLFFFMLYNAISTNLRKILLSSLNHEIMHQNCAHSPTMLQSLYAQQQCIGKSTVITHFVTFSLFRKHRLARKRAITAVSSFIDTLSWLFQFFFFQDCLFSNKMKWQIAQTMTNNQKELY